MDPLAASSPEALAELCRRHNVRQLDLVGSAASGNFQMDRSDLDFLVQFEPVHDRSYADAYFGLREGLETLFGRSVDLITAASIENPYLKASLDSQRRRLF